MRAFVQMTLVALALGAPCFAQQVSFRNLTASWRVPEDHIPPPSSDNCSAVNHGIFGEAVRKDPAPPKSDKSLELTILQIASPRIVIGEEFIATVDLKNVGNIPVRIPWESDGEKVTRVSQDGTEEKYEVADVNFRLSSVGTKHAAMPLQSEGALFAHPDDPASYLQLRPGEWVEIKVKGTMECGLENCSGNLAADQHAVLTAWWYQRVLTHRVKNCNDDHGSDEVREVESPPFSVAVHAAAPAGPSANQ